MNLTGLYPTIASVDGIEGILGSISSVPELTYGSINYSASTEL